MAFVYRFEKVLNVKKELLKRTEKDLADAMRRQSEEVQTLNGLLLTDEQSHEELIRNSQRQSVRAEQFMQTQHFFDALKNQISFQRRRVTKADELVKVAKLNLQKAMQAESMFEKDKENRIKEYLSEQLHIEQNLLDEMAQTIAFRHRNESD